MVRRRSLGVEPDILTGAKGINSGYIPLGTMSVSEELGYLVEGLSVPWRAHIRRASCSLRERYLGAIRAMQGREHLGPSSRR